MCVCVREREREREKERERQTDRERDRQRAESRETETCEAIPLGSKGMERMSSIVCSTCSDKRVSSLLLYYIIIMPNSL